MFETSLKHIEAAEALLETDHPGRSHREALFLELAATSSFEDRSQDRVTTSYATKHRSCNTASDEVRSKFKNLDGRKEWDTRMSPVAPFPLPPKRKRFEDGSLPFSEREGVSQETHCQFWTRAPGRGNFWIADLVNDNNSRESSAPELVYANIDGATSEHVEYAPGDTIDGVLSQMSRTSLTDTDDAINARLVDEENAVAGAIERKQDDTLGREAELGGLRHKRQVFSRTGGGGDVVMEDVPRRPGRNPMLFLD